MAEIKSAIELAMEKTKSLVIDLREREAMAIKEIEDKVKAVLRRFTEKIVDHEDAARELDKIQADRILKRTMIIDNLVEEFDVHKDNERLFALFHDAEIPLPQSIHSEFEKLQTMFREEVGGREVAVRKRIRDILASSGITGDAIEPNLDAWEEWHEDIEQTGNIFEKKIRELKDKVKVISKST